MNYSIKRFEISVMHIGFHKVRPRTLINISLVESMILPSCGHLGVETAVLFIPHVLAEELQASPARR